MGKEVFRVKRPHKRRERKGRGGNGRGGERRGGEGRGGEGREGKGREGKGREGKGREGKGREGKGREGERSKRSSKVKQRLIQPTRHNWCVSWVQYLCAVKCALLLPTALCCSWWRSWSSCGMTHSVLMSSVVHRHRNGDRTDTSTCQNCTLRTPTCRRTQNWSHRGSHCQLLYNT